MRGEVRKPKSQKRMEAGVSNFTPSSSHLFVLLLFVASAFSQDAFKSEVSVKDIDSANTAAFLDGETKTIKPEVLVDLLSSLGTGTSWSAEEPAISSKKSKVIHYRLAFSRPIEVGTMIALLHQGGSEVTFSYLNSNAVYPGDPNRAVDWETIPARKYSGQFVHTFSSGFKTRALLLTEKRSQPGSALYKWTLLKARLHDLTPYAIAQGERLPYGWDPDGVTRGGAWKNVGENEDKQILRPPVSSANPSWFSLAWETKQKPDIIRLHSNIDLFKLYAYVGDERLNPAVAPKESWQRIQFTEMRKPTMEAEGTRRLLRLESIETIALKIDIIETLPREQQVVFINELTTWSDLGQAKIPPPPVRDAPPPFGIPYEMERDGEVALVVEDMQGHRVRNLIAQVERKAGLNTEYWDLKDEDNLPVPVGTYRWKAIYAPPLELHYQFTPYPNVELHSPNSRPWNGRPQDGWLSNHGNQSAVCAVGDRLYIAAGGTEGGHAFIETSLNGEKLWGTHWGASRLFTDGKTLFIQAGNSISRFDQKTRQQVGIINYGLDPNRKGELVGLAANAGKVYMAFHAPVPYFDNATHSGKVDIDNCLPKLKSEVKRTANYGIPAQPQRDFISLFRLGGYIGGDPSFGSLIYLETTEGYSRRQSILLAFKEPVPIGCLVFPRHEDPSLQLGLSLLKPQAQWPPVPRRKADWIKIETGNLNYWNCIPAPEGASTRALLVTFTKPGDELDELDEEGNDPDKPKLADLGEDDPDDLIQENNRKLWQTRIEGMRLLRRRYTSLLDSATIRVNSGKFDPTIGEWDAERSQILSEKNPAIFAMEWKKPQSIRGLAIKEIDGELTHVDIYQGPEDEPIDIKADAHWLHVTDYRQSRRNFYQPDASNNASARYLGGFADFGQDYETRAVRLRVVRQWAEKGGYPAGVRRDRGGTTVDPKRCRTYGIAPLQYLGGELPTDDLISRRLAVFDGESGKLLRETPSDILGQISFDPAGNLYGIVGSKVVRIDEETRKQTDFVTDARQPRHLTFDGKGRLYLYDHAPEERVVRVYDPKGKFLHLIGTRGPKKAGDWDPASIGEVCAMSADQADNVWLVYPHENPRRIIQFKSDGKFVKELLCNTHYGGGGVLDPYDKTRLFYKDMVFGLDWERGTTSIKSLLSLNYWEASPWGDSFRSDMMPIKIEGRLYLVTVPLLYTHLQSVGVVYLVDEQTLTMRMVAAIGSAASFPFVKTPEFLELLGGEPVGKFKFNWADRNGDGEVQAAEVTFTRMTGTSVSLGRFDRELGVMAGSARYEVKEFLKDGTPIFEEKRLSFDSLYRLNNGNYFRYGTRGNARENSVNEVLSPNGERIWTYKAWGGVSGLWIPEWAPGYVTNQFGISGHASDEGDLGEFFVIHANTGQMNLWTADGLLAAHVTLHTRDPRSKGWPADHQRGARLDGLTLGQEHFHHYFCKMEQDGKYYIVAGGNHISVVEVKGIEKFKRLSGEINITPEIAAQTRKWESKKVRRQVFAEAPLIVCRPVNAVPRLDGSVGENEWGEKASGSEITRLAEFRVGYDAQFLYLCWQVKSGGPFKNIGDDFHRYFKTGAAVDLKLGTDPSADPRREQPVEGDLRLLITAVQGKPVAVLYRPVAPGAMPSQAWKTSTPAGGTTSFDLVSKLDDVRISFQETGETGYIVEAAVPLKTLGITIKEVLLLKMDWGVLSTEEGNLTTARNYWANKMAVGTTDEPTEAKLQPHLWGNIRFEREWKMAGPEDLLKGGPGGGEVDILEDLDELD